jgi:hypothetical protein
MGMRKRVRVTTGHSSGIVGLFRGGGPVAKAAGLVADARQGFHDVTAIQKDSVQRLRTAWTPVYNAARDGARDQFAGAKARADQLAETIDIRGGRPSSDDTVQAAKPKRAAAKG